MLGLKDFLDTVKEPKIIIPTLIAIIIVGAVGGGLWVNVLNNKVDNFKEALTSNTTIAKGELALVQNSNREKIARIERRLDDFIYDMKRTRNEIEATKDDLNRAVDSINILVEASTDQNIKTKTKEIQGIKSKYNILSEKLNTLDSQLRETSADISLLNAQPNSLTEDNHTHEYTIPLIVLTILSLLCTFYFFVRSKIKKKPKGGEAATN